MRCQLVGLRLRRNAAPGRCSGSSARGGMSKRVRPWVFGNVRDRDILAIWNDAASRSFRERVLGYQFPFCFDCGFALCDYVGEEEFEQDCYIEPVPCGACLWCTGLFHCLQ